MYKFNKISGGVPVGVLVASFVGLILLGVGVYKFGNLSLNSNPADKNQLAANVSGLFSDSNTGLLDHFDKESSLFGSTSGSLTYVDGPAGLGKAIRFSAGSYAREKSLTFIPSGQNWTEGTIEFWVRPEQYPTSGNQQYLIHFNWNTYPNPSAGYLGDISLRSDGRISYQCGWGWNNAATPTVVSNSSVPSNQWTHVAAVWSSSQGTKLYLNNNLDASISQGCASGSNGNIYPWLAGYGGFVGAMDELRISKVARSAPFYSGDPGATESSLILTAPNGGEKWQIGSTHTIQWTPYDPQQNLNVVPDVVAYLEKSNSSGGFTTVGKILEVGKASIHWAGEIDRYGNYPEPGQYYIRIENTETGQSDRSDKPFELLPRDSVKADLKLNGSDGPFRISSGGSTVKFAWTSVSADTCNLYLDPLAGNITGLPPSGEREVFLKPASYVTQASLTCTSHIGNAWDKVDVQPPVQESYITVTSPNGGENIDFNSVSNISWNFSSDINKVSVALYKNDAFFKWIISDWARQSSAGGISGGITWSPSGNISSNDIGGQVFKIYAIGYKDSGGTVEDKSDAPFTITAPTASALPHLGSISPTQGTVNDTITISGTNLTSGGNPTVELYSSSNQLIATVQFIDMDFISSETLRFHNAFRNQLDNSASIAPGTYKVEVLTPAGRSDNWVNFTITAPTRDVRISVSDGKPLVIGSSYSIQWTGLENSSDTYSVHLVKEGSQTRLIDTVIGSLGKFTWTVPRDIVTPSSGWRIRLTGKAESWESGPFDIIAPTQPAPTSSIKVVSPNGGGTWEIGKTYNIQWTLSTSESVDPPLAIYLMGFDEFGGSYIAHTISTSARNNSHSWTVPSTIKPGKYLIRAVAYPEDKTKSYEDSSDASFTITMLTATELSAEEPVAPLSTLTETQITAIIGLLQSFGADAETIANVNNALRGLPTSQSSTTASPTTLEPQEEPVQPTYAPAAAAPATESAAEGQIETFSYTWNRDLYYGLADDADVRALQNALILEGVYRGPVTGNFFELTRQGVIDFQKKHNFTSIPDTGYVGPYTRQVLNDIYSE